MAATEFQIDVTDRRVEGRFGYPSEALTLKGAADLDLDVLTMETVAQMDALLNYWNLIYDSKIPYIKELLGERTLKVIGKQLWRLLLTNPVGEALVEQLENPKNQPLRLLLAFADNANPTLRGLPWEFLFEPRRYGFLSVNTDLLLTRYVPPTELRRPRVETVENDQLRVLLLAALPEERKGTDPRAVYWKLGSALNNVSGLDVKHLGCWDREQVKEAMSSDPPVQIVHVVGICKGPPGAPKIFLGGEGDGFEDPEELVDALTGPGTHRPQLVILHLCDYQDGDASENFERLAPALVKAGVPAVLALQYAALADEVGVGASFYKRLLDGERIGAAVQTSRTALGTKDRRFGTPVLYLGDDGPLRKRRKIDDPVAAFSAGTTGTVRRDRDLRQKLLEMVISAPGVSKTSRSLLTERLKSIPEGSKQVRAARDLLTLELRARHDQETQLLLAQMLIEATNDDGSRS